MTGVSSRGVISATSSAEGGLGVGAGAGLIQPENKRSKITNDVKARYLNLLFNIFPKVVLLKRRYPKISVVQLKQVTLSN